MSVESLVDWQRRLSLEAFERGDHKPASWSTTYDDGTDGCMPAGWYLEGLNSNGMQITFPVRHEYGPFDTQQQAEAHVAVVETDTILKEMTR